MIADLHLHSRASDGDLTPRALITTSKALKIPIVAITDHDNISGIDEAIIAGQEKEIKVIPGIELSSYSDIEMHILGYNIDYKSPKFVEELEKIQKRRLNRNLEIIDNLKKKGINLDYNDINRKGSSIGRLHIAQLMYQKGYIAHVPEAFDNYIGANGSCYVKSEYITPKEAIELILDSGGVPVLAHPYRFIEEGKIKKYIEMLEGLQGIETWYPLHSPAIIEEIKKIAKFYNLITTGGSDFHSPNHGSPLGSANYHLDEKTAEHLGVI